LQTNSLVTPRPWNRGRPRLHRRTERGPRVLRWRQRARPRFQVLV